MAFCMGYEATAVEFCLHQQTGQCYKWKLVTKNKSIFFTLMYLMPSDGNVSIPYMQVARVLKHGKKVFIHQGSYKIETGKSRNRTGRRKVDNIK
jgi:hypothetical protein